MSLKPFLFFALPLWAVFFALFFRVKKHGLKLEAILAKCGGTFLPFAWAALLFWRVGEPLWKQPIVWFFLLCLIADALLEVWFLPGMLVFAGAHLTLGVYLIAACFHSGGIPWWGPLIWAGAVALAALLFRKELPTLGRLAPAFVGYAAVLSAMLALGVLLWTRGAWPLGLGLTCFYLSDMMVARIHFHPEKERILGIPIMALYWGALFLIALQLW